VTPPQTAILAALAGAVFGFAGNWFTNLDNRGDSTAATLIELAASVKHIDKTLERYEAAFDGSRATQRRHEYRITRLETKTGFPDNATPANEPR
jgi:hypothetical protein